MTAPAVVRRWNDPRPAPLVGSRGGELVTALVGGCTIRLRRVAPLGAVLLSGLVLHAAVVPHVTVRGLTPDLLLVAVVAVAVSRGSRAGAGFGFAAGLGADLFLATPLGTSALAYTLVGHLFGKTARVNSPGKAASALCGPDSACFACRNDRLHAGHGRSALDSEASRPGGATPQRLSRARRRAAARRAALRRSALLTVMGVGAGRVGTAIVATTLAGVPFPGPAALVRMAGVAALSAPLGPAAMTFLQRIRQPAGGPV